MTHLVECKESVQLHHCEVVSEEDEGGNVDDVLWAVPEMREQLGGTRRHEPDDVTDHDIPAEDTMLRSNVETRKNE